MTSLAAAEWREGGRDALAKGTLSYDLGELSAVIDPSEVSDVAAVLGVRVPAVPFPQYLGMSTPGWPREPMARARMELASPAPGKSSSSSTSSFSSSASTAAHPLRCSPTVLWRLADMRAISLRQSHLAMG